MDIFIFIFISSFKINFFFGFGCANVSPCGSNSNPKYVNEFQYGNWCYFVIKGATAASNPVINRTHFIFKPDLARQLCNNEGATLPIIHSIQERVFLSDMYKAGFENWTKIPFLALGLSQYNRTTKLIYKWDDGSDHDNWTTAGNNPFLYARMATADVMSWDAINTIEPEPSPVGVVCQIQYDYHHKRQQRAIGKLKKSICDSWEDMSINRRSIFNNESCYFAPELAKDEANTANKDNEGRYTESYTFHITKAREICQRYNATLPIINNHKKHIWLSRHGRLGDFIHNIAIDLLQVKSGPDYIYEWKNGDRMDYETLWPTKYTPASYTVFQLGSDEGTWINRLANETFFLPTHVVCEQPYSLSKPTITTTPSSTESYSECAYENKFGILKKALYENRYCYFIIYGVITKSNGDGQPDYNIFNIWRATNWCQRHNATLPILTEKGEYDFIRSEFKSGHFLRPPKYVEYVALALKQTKNVHSYKWVDGTALKYEPTNWIDKDKYAVFTLMSLENETWRNFDTIEILRTPKNHEIGVLCKQYHDPTKTPYHNTTATATRIYNGVSSNATSTSTTVDDRKIVETQVQPVINHT